MCSMPRFLACLEDVEGISWLFMHRYGHCCERVHGLEFWPCFFSELEVHFTSIFSDLEVHFLVNFKDLPRLIHSTSTAKDISTAVL